MTRAEIVQDLDEVAQAIEATNSGHYDGAACELFSPEDAVSLKAAAAELSKTCATCRQWQRRDDGIFCRSEYAGFPGMPKNGSGFCSLWEVKP